MNSQFDQSQNPFNSSTMGVSTVAQASVEARMDFIRKTYTLFMAGILTAIVGGVVSLNSPISSIVMATAPWSLLSIIALSIVAQIMVDKPGLNYIALFGFTFLLGAIMAPVIALYAPAVVGQAGFLTAVIFATLTAYVFVTRQDFNWLGGIVFVGLITLIIAGVANAFFFKSSGFSYWLSWGVLVMSSGWVLYDTSEIIHRYPLSGYCSAALGLFISFWNIFISLLNILGGNRD